MRRLIALFLLAVSSAPADPTVVTLKWEDFQSVAEHVEFRKKVTIRTGEEGQDRIRAKLVGVSDAGITISKKGPTTATHTLIGREEVHSVRISPKWGNPLKWRTVASIAAFPLWFVGMNLGLAIPGGIPQGRWYKNPHAPQGFALAFGLPTAVYLLAQRADRRNGAIIINLDEGKENLK